MVDNGHQTGIRGAWGSFLLLCGLLSAVLLAGCEPNADETGSNREGYIAVVGTSTQDPLWPILRASAERETALVGSIKIKVAAPDAPSPTKQAQLVQEMRDEHLLGVCIQPVDPVVQLGFLKGLQDDGIAVVSMISALPEESGIMVSRVDEIAVGRAMADALSEAVGGEGNVAVLYDGGEDAEHPLRYVGFCERMSQLPAIEVLRSIDCEGDEIQAKRELRELMAKYPRLRGWASLENWVLRHEEPSRQILPDTCQLVTSCPFPRYWPRINDGTCYALVGADYGRVAAKAIQMCITDVRGGDTSERMYMAPPVVVTRKTLPSFGKTWSSWVESPSDRP